MSSFQYVNLNLNNTSSTTTTSADLSVVNNPYILKDVTNDWKVGIDRIIIKRAQTPLYKSSSRSLQIKLINTGTSAEGVGTLSFSSYVDSNNFVYSYQHYVEALNTAMNTASSNVGNAGNVPVFSYIPSSNKIKLSYDGTFKGTYDIYFNSALFSDIPSFPYDIVNPEDEFLKLDYNNETDEGSGNYSFTTSEGVGLHLNPVSMVEVLVVGLPIVGEISGNNIQQKILTDFSLNYDTSTPENDIVYNALDGQYRWHSLTARDEIREFDLKIRYRTIDDEYYDLKINSGGSINVKLAFKHN